MQEHTIGAGEAGLRLDLWLARHAGAESRSRAAAWLERGKVFINGAEADTRQAAYRVVCGDRIGLWVDRPGSARMADRAVAEARGAIAVIHEDADVVVLDKAPGLIVEPLPGGDEEPTVIDLLRDRYRHLPRARAYVVHRIDRDTSGLVLFARTPAARDYLKAQFEARTPARRYQAVVEGVLLEDGGTWRDALAWDKAALRQRRAHASDAGAKEAVAEVRVLDRFAAATLLEVSLVTGKRNQIRVQAGLRGFPLLGERQYRFGTAPDPSLPAFDRQALHAWQLGFVHPATGRPLTVTAPLPDDFARLLRQLRAGARGPASRPAPSRGRR
jgi:23S rRNA pseudouridine1911/1915/1917 synthase